MKKAGKALALLLALLMLAALAACALPGKETDDGDEEISERHSSKTDRRGSQEQTPETEQPQGEPQQEAEPQSEPAISEAVRVTLERSYDDSMEKAVLRGLDKEGTEIWRLESSAPATELTRIEEIGLWGDRYYFNDGGTVTALRVSDGEVLWVNRDFRGAGISSLVDGMNGNIYLCGYYGPDFFAVDAEGKTLADFRSVSDDHYWAYGMRWHGENELVVYYEGGPGTDATEEGLPYCVDLRDFSISYGWGVVELDAQTQYEANIFLSNFAEQRIETLIPAEAPDSELADFAFRFFRINRSGEISYGAQTEKLPLDKANDALERYTGRRLSDAPRKLREDGYGHVWQIADGQLVFPAEPDLVANRFAVVSEICRLEDGTLAMSFDVYAMDAESWRMNGMDASLYRISSTRARQLLDQGTVAYLGSGRATAVPYRDGARSSYQLLSYESWIY